MFAKKALKWGLKVGYFCIQSESETTGAGTNERRTD